MRRQTIRLLALLPIWFILFISSFNSGNAEGCTTKRVWDKKEQGYAYYFECDLPIEETLLSTPPEPSISPSPTPSTASPAASVEPTPTLLPTEPAPTPSPDNSEPAPLPTPSESVIDTSIPDPIVLDNGVVISAQVNEALQVLDNPVDAIVVGFTDPKKLIKAVSNIGADMRPEVRDTAQKTVVSAIIVVQVIGGTVTTLIRKP